MYIYVYKMKHWKALFIRYVVAISKATHLLHNFAVFLFISVFRKMFSFVEFCTLYTVRVKKM